MRNLVIREAITLSHKYNEKYGGEWHVTSGMDVVQPSYFYSEDGTAKQKPFYSLYNTTDKTYCDRYKIKYEQGQIFISTINI